MKEKVRLNWKSILKIHSTVNTPYEWEFTVSKSSRFVIVHCQSRLSKNQWSFTVRKDYRFLLSLDLLLSSSRKSKFISSFSILNSRVIRQMELKPEPDFTLSSSSLLPRYYLPFPDFTVKDQYSRFILVHCQSILNSRFVILNCKSILNNWKICSFTFPWTSLIHEVNPLD